MVRRYRTPNIRSHGCILKGDFYLCVDGSSGMGRNFGLILCIKISLDLSNQTASYFLGMVTVTVSFELFGKPYEPKSGNK